jgi:DNA-binding helix-hairpin-helix protein with protein kinase domain
MTEPAFIFSTQCSVLDYLAEAEMAHSAGQSAHPNLLVNSRVIQALRRLAAAWGAPMETRYKNYRIEVYQTEIRRWRARIRRLDGKKVKVATTGEQHEFLPTTGARGAITARTAIDVAKALIDDGGID